MGTWRLSHNLMFIQKQHSLERSRPIGSVKICRIREDIFNYMVLKLKGIEWKVMIPYIRQGQAWMLKV
jgi:hypothetical protein